MCEVFPFRKSDLDMLVRDDLTKMKLDINAFVFYFPQFSF